MSVKDFVFYSIDITPSGIVASIVASSCVGENANVLRMHFPLHLHTWKTNMKRFQFYALKWPFVYCFLKHFLLFYPQHKFNFELLAGRSGITFSFLL